MSDVKLPFARTRDNKMVSIDAVVRGLACECFCPQCNQALVAAKGDVVRHHFRHYSDASVGCTGAHETALHLFAKQVIQENPGKLLLPDIVDDRQVRHSIDLGMAISAETEVTLPNGNIRPDVLIQYPSESVAVEVFVAHRVGREKIKLLFEQEQTALEIDISLHRYGDKSEQEWIDLIFQYATRHWLVEPKFVRLERVKQHEAEIERRQRFAAMAKIEVKTEDEKIKEATKRLNDLIKQQNKIALEEQSRKALAREKATVDELSKQNIAKQLAEYEQREVERILNDMRIRKALAEQRAAEHEANLKEEERRSLLVRAIEEHDRRERLPPDLQALVQAYGDYSSIPQEAWEDYQAKLADWQMRTRYGEGGSMTNRRRAKAL